MTQQFTLDLDTREETPKDKEEASATTPGDEVLDIYDEYSSFEDLHYRKTDDGG